MTVEGTAGRRSTSGSGRSRGHPSRSLAPRPDRVDVLPPHLARLDGQRVGGAAGDPEPQHVVERSPADQAHREAAQQAVARSHRVPRRPRRYHGVHSPALGREPGRPPRPGTPRPSRCRRAASARAARGRGARPVDRLGGQQRLQLLAVRLDQEGPRRHGARAAGRRWRRPGSARPPRAGP